MNKKDLDEVVEQVFKPLDKEQDEDLKKLQEEFSSYKKNILATVREIREKAVIAYFDKLSNQDRRGSNREVRRRVYRWLDKVGASFIDNEDSFSFSVVSDRYSATLEVDMKATKKGYEYNFEWLE